MILDVVFMSVKIELLSTKSDPILNDIGPGMSIHLCYIICVICIKIKCIRPSLCADKINLYSLVSMITKKKEKNTRKRLRQRKWQGRENRQVMLCASHLNYHVLVILILEKYIIPRENTSC